MRRSDKWLLPQAFPIAFRWIEENPADDKTALIQVMAWCRQATSHYLIQCWSISMSYMASLGHNELSLQVLVSYCTSIGHELGYHWAADALAPNGHH